MKSSSTLKRKADPKISPKASKKSKVAKHKSLSPEPQESVPFSANGPKSRTDEDEEISLHGFSSDDDDSSDEDDVSNESNPLDVEKLPTVAKDDATVKAKLEKAKKRSTEQRGVIYLGRLPHGFYEDQLKAYFSQFGDVTRLRVSRNKKTGKSKHYAFLEFQSAEVAQIVADTMDNYLLLGHILRCKVVPKSDIHPELWVGANRKWRRVPRDRIARQRQEKPRTPEEKERAAKRQRTKLNQRQKRLQAAGIDYDLKAVGKNIPITV